MAMSSAGHLAVGADTGDIPWPDTFTGSVFRRHSGPTALGSEPNAERTGIAATEMDLNWVLAGPQGHDRIIAGINADHDTRNGVGIRSRVEGNSLQASHPGTPHPTCVMLQSRAMKPVI